MQWISKDKYTDHEHLQINQSINQSITGIVFEENSPDVGGIFAFELQPLHLRKFGAAVEEGDQLIAVNGANAKGLSFEDAMDMIIAAEEDALGRVSLTFLRDD